MSAPGILVGPGGWVSPSLALATKIYQIYGADLLGLWIGEDILVDGANNITSWPGRVGAILTGQTAQNFGISTINGRKTTNSTVKNDKSFLIPSTTYRSIISVAECSTLPITDAGYLAGSGTQNVMVAAGTPAEWLTNTGFTHYADGIPSESVTLGPKVYESVKATATTQTLNIGGITGFSIYDWLGKIGSFIQLAVVSSATQRAQVTAALQEYYGLAVTHTIFDADLWDNSAAQRLAMSESRWVLGDDTSMTLTASTDYAGASAGKDFGPSVYVDDVYIGTMAIPAVVGQSQETFVLPGVPGGELVIRNGSCGDLWVQDHATYLTVKGARIIAPTSVGHRVVCDVDSVGNGWNCAAPNKDGWLALLKPTFNMTAYGCGGRAFFTDSVDIPGYAAKIVGMLNGTIANTFIFALGINDAAGGFWAGSGGAAGFAASVGTALDAIHALSPSAHVILWGCQTCAGGAEATVAPYRTALLGLAAARAAWCSVHNSSLYPVQLDAGDVTGLHPDEVGHLAIKNHIEPDIAAVY